MRVVQTVDVNYALMEDVPRSPFFDSIGTDGVTCAPDMAAAVVWSEEERSVSVYMYMHQRATKDAYREARHVCSTIIDYAMALAGLRQEQLRSF
jgi:hypothetical protein